MIRRGLGLAKALPINLYNGITMKPSTSCINKHYFHSLNLKPKIVDTLKSAGFETPTNIQQLAIPRILAAKDIILAGEPGCGKTLAYVIPILQGLPEHDGKVKPPSPGKPRAVIVAPTTELAKQITAVIKTLSREYKFRSVFIRPTFSKTEIAKRMSLGPDIVVATPGRLQEMLDENLMSFKDLRHFIVDEADTLFQYDFGILLNDITHHIKRKENVDFLVCSSMLLKPYLNELHHRLPHMKSAVTVDSDTLYAANPKVNYVFLKVTDKENEREVAFKMAIKEFDSTNRKRIKAGEQPKKALVFADTSRATKYISFFLKELNIKHEMLNGKSFYGDRKRAIENFEKENETNILVCTDILSKGMDFTNLTNVFNFNFPLTYAEFVHRCGRTGRNGGEGSVVSFYSTRNGPLVRLITSSLESSGDLGMMASKCDVPREMYFLATDSRRHRPHRMRRVKGEKRYIRKPIASPFVNAGAIESIDSYNRHIRRARKSWAGKNLETETPKIDVFNGIFLSKEQKMLRFRTRLSRNVARAKKLKLLRGPLQPTDAESNTSKYSQILFGKKKKNTSSNDNPVDEKPSTKSSPISKPSSISKARPTSNRQKRERDATFDHLKNFGIDYDSY